VLDGAPRVEGVQVLFSQVPKMDSTMHYGCRLAFANDGTFFLTTGERSILPGRRQAQQLNSHLGKVVRLNPDGSIPADNPFANGAGRPEIWSYGHRNMQGAAMRPGTTQYWTHEHGARGGDEVNKVERGKDYGWPTITYGVEYAGGRIGEGISQRPGMEQPVYYWDPVIAPSGMAFYTGDLVPEWKGNLFIGGLKTQNLVRLVLDGDRIKAEEWLLKDLGKRIRDVRNGPDGALWLLTDEGDLLRVAPG
jgi:aldose sugar dehydrogenase